MFEQLEKIESRYQELEGFLALPADISDKELYNRYAKELSALKNTVSLFREYKKVCAEIEGLEDVLSQKQDKEFLELAQKELKERGLAE